MRAFHRIFGITKSTTIAEFLIKDWGEGNEFEIIMPENTQILSVKYDGKGAMMYGLIDPNNKMIKRKFIMFGRGFPIKQKHLNYISTFQFNFGDEYVAWHFFEIKTKEDV